MCVFSSKLCWLCIYGPLHHLSTFPVLKNIDAQKFFVECFIKDSGQTGVMMQVLKLTATFILSFQKDIAFAVNL